MRIPQLSNTSLNRVFMTWLMTLKGCYWHVEWIELSAIFFWNIKGWFGQHMGLLGETVFSFNWWWGAILGSMLCLYFLKLDGMIKVEFMVEKSAWMMLAKTKLCGLLMGWIGYTLFPIDEFVSWISHANFQGFERWNDDFIYDIMHGRKTR